MSEFRKRKPSGGIALPGLAGLKPPKRTVISETTERPSESNKGSETPEKLRHYTLDRPRFKNRPPSRRGRLTSAAASLQAAPPPSPLLDLPPPPPPQLSVDDFSTPDLPNDPPPGLPDGPPPDLPDESPPDLPETTPPTAEVAPVSPPSVGASPASNPGATLTVESPTKGAPSPKLTRLLDKYKAGRTVAGGRKPLKSLSGVGATPRSPKLGKITLRKTDGTSKTPSPFGTSGLALRLRAKKEATASAKDGTTSSTTSGSLKVQREDKLEMETSSSHAHKPDDAAAKMSSTSAGAKVEEKPDTLLPPATESVKDESGGDEVLSSLESSTFQTPNLLSTEPPPLKSPDQTTTVSLRTNLPSPFKTDRDGDMKQSALSPKIPSAEKEEVSESLKPLPDLPSSPPSDSSEEVTLKSETKAPDIVPLSRPESRFSSLASAGAKGGSGGFKSRFSRLSSPEDDDGKSDTSSSASATSFTKFSLSSRWKKDEDDGSLSKETKSSSLPRFQLQRGSSDDMDASSSSSMAKRQELWKKKRFTVQSLSSLRSFSTFDDSPKVKRPRRSILSITTKLQQTTDPEDEPSPSSRRSKSADFSKELKNPEPEAHTRQSAPPFVTAGDSPNLPSPEVTEIEEEESPPDLPFDEPPDIPSEPPPPVPDSLPPIPDELPPDLPETAPPPPMPEGPLPDMPEESVERGEPSGLKKVKVQKVLWTESTEEKAEMDLDRGMTEVAELDPAAQKETKTRRGFAPEEDDSSDLLTAVFAALKSPDRCDSPFRPLQPATETKSGVDDEDSKESSSDRLPVSEIIDMAEAEVEELEVASTAFLKDEVMSEKGAENDVTDEPDGSLDFQSKDIDKWTKSDVGNWLVSRGLDEESSVFNHADIDGPSLLNLDEQALASIGVSEDQRSPILRAVRALLITRRMTASEQQCPAPIIRPPTLFRYDSPLSQTEDRPVELPATDEVEATSLLSEPVSVGTVEGWSVDEVAVWLNQQQLHHYVSVFRVHRVNGKKLLEIDFELLDEMDIMSPDEREVILAEVYELSVGSGGEDPEATLEASLEEQFGDSRNEEEKFKMLAAMEALKSPTSWDDAGSGSVSVETSPSGTTTEVSPSASQSDYSLAKSSRPLETKSKSTSEKPKKEKPTTKKEIKNSDGSGGASDGRARKLSEVFGVAQSSPAIRHSLDRGESGVVRIGLAALETGLAHKALHVSSNATAVTVIEMILDKLELVDDPRRYSLFEVSSKKKVVDREVASFEFPLQVQSRWPANAKLRFELRMRPSGVIKITGFIPGMKSDTRAIAVSPSTSCRDVVRLALRKFQVKNDPNNKYCLFECTSKTAEERIVGEGEYPLMVQAKRREQNAFHLKLAPALRSERDSGTNLLPSSSHQPSRTEATLRAENASLRVELESMKTKASRLKSLEEALSTLRHEYDSLRESTAEREALEREEKAGLNEEIEELRQMNAPVGADAQGNDEVIASVVKDLEAVYATRISSLEQEVHRQAKSIKKFEEENDALKKQSSGPGIETAEPKRLEEKELLLGSLNDRLGDQEAKIDSLQKENEALRTEIESRRSDGAEMNQTDIEKKDQIIAALRSEIDRHGKLAQEQDEAINELTASLRAANTGQQTLLSLATARPMVVVAVDIDVKAKQSIGLTVAEGTQMRGLGLFGEGLFIKNVKSGSPAQNCRQLNVGDRILEINGEDVSRTTLSHMKKALAKSKGRTRLVIARQFVSDSDQVSKQNQLQHQIVALTAKVDAQKTENEQLTIECSRLKAKSERNEAKDISPLLVDDLRSTVQSLNQQLMESESGREELRKVLNEMHQSASSVNQQFRETEQSLEGHIEMLQTDLRKHQKKLTEIREVVRGQESNISSLQRAVQEKDDALSLTQVERDHAMKLLQERAEGQSTEDLVSVPDDYKSATKEELVRMLQERENEYCRQKTYMDQLLSLVIEHAPTVLGKLHAHEEASLKSDEWC